MSVRIVALLVFFFFLFFRNALASFSSETPLQQISDFSLSGYEDKGRKSWDISGKSADVFTEVVKLKDISGNLYTEDEKVNLTAKKGDFNKSEDKVYLEDNVVITTSKGTKLTTDSMDWDRRNKLVATEDKVNINRDNINISGVGALGEPNLNKVSLNKDIRVDISPLPTEIITDNLNKGKVLITCDGPLEVDYNKNIATFYNNVRVERQDIIIYSDRMDAFFATDRSEVKKVGSPQEPVAGSIEMIIAKGNVRIIRGDNISYSDEAVYNAKDKKIILNGKPQLVFYSKEEF